MMKDDCFGVGEAHLYPHPQAVVEVRAGRSDYNRYQLQEKLCSDSNFHTLFSFPHGNYEK